MNELMDHRLKKMNHDVKYKKVPMGEHETHKIIHHVKNRPVRNYRTTHWKKTLPLSTVAAAAVIAFQFYSYPSNTETQEATLASQRSANIELKEQQMVTAEEQESIELLSGNKDEASPIVRKTYVIHKDSLYVQTERQVQPQLLDKSIGTAVPQESSNQRQSSLPQQEKIYAVKGEEEQEAVAIKSWRYVGTGASRINQKGYFIFEREESLPLAQ
ncbi:hypothetical protein [Halobacillus massiliensis]|uniref:hypothetical protein n=1 Tax=Halobacillus massiliensis TaxID=1926286 RepID=UPI0009E1B05D|nr:hypothetical protein [Halobacillus massiliensis]